MAVQAAGRAVAIDAARVCSERELGGSAFSPAVARRSLVAELACALRIPESTASGLMESSRALAHDLPDTLAALSQGKIGYRQALILANETAGLGAEAAARLEAEALPWAGRLTPSQFERRTRKVRERIEPESITARHARSVEDRSVRFDPARDGMGWLSAFLPAVDAVGIYNQVTDRVTWEPGNLDGYGPIDPDTARALAAKCPSCVRILTHPETGAVLSVGRDRYTIPTSLRTMLRVRDGTCRHPGCSRAATRSDIDHSLDSAFGGKTDHNNGTSS